MTVLYDHIDHDVFIGDVLGQQILAVIDRGGHVAFLTRSGSISVLLRGAIHRLARVRYAASGRHLAGDGFPLEVGETGHEEFRATTCGWWAGPAWRSTSAARVEVLPTSGAWPQEVSVDLVAKARHRWLDEVRARGDDARSWVRTPPDDHPAEPCSAPNCLLRSALT